MMWNRTELEGSSVVVGDLELLGKAVDLRDGVFLGIGDESSEPCSIIECLGSLRYLVPWDWTGAREF